MVDKPASFSYNGTQHSYVPARPHRLTVRTPGLHPGNPGSIPGEVTKPSLIDTTPRGSIFYLYGEYGAYPYFVVTYRHGTKIEY